MTSFRKRSLFLVCTGAVSVPLVAAALAYGCTAVATISFDKTAGAAGSTVSVTGKFFGTHDAATDNTNGLAEIRLGSLTGPVLATAAPAGTDRSFTVQVQIPAGTPAGDTFIAATQKRADGTRVYGTPARQSFKVTAAAAPAPAAGAPTFVAPNRVMTTVPQNVAETLTLAEARRVARTKIKRSSRSARNIRARCSRRSATSATCRVQWTSNGKKKTKRVVVNAQASAASAW